MGIKLDWQVESEQTQVRASEDPAARRQRHAARRRLILFVIVLMSLIALVGALALWRLERIDHQLRQDLIDTVQIEVTALRLGNFNNFMAIQRSSSNPFLVEQQREYEDYQRLKQVRRVELGGEVLDVAIDDRTGRVIVKEIIDGVPYKVVWYYWYYEDDGASDQTGWRRVPDNLEFWGDPGEITLDAVRVTYHGLDADLAAALAPRAQDWWTQGCVILGCLAQPPQLHIDIVAAKPVTIEWAAYDPWTLRVVSPLVERARADIPLPPDLEQAITHQIALRLVRYAAGEVVPIAASDAAWLHDDLARWLTESLLANDGAATSTGFVGTLITQYGPGAPGTVLRALGTNSTIDEMMAAITGVGMAFVDVNQLNALNWQSFFQWRLELEASLLNGPDGSGAFLALYDLENFVLGDTAQTAQARLNDPAYAARRVPRVDAVTIARDQYGQTLAYVDTTRPDAGSAVSEQVIWRLVPGSTWKRAN
jgi:hypothetical protein